MIIASRVIKLATKEIN